MRREIERRLTNMETTNEVLRKELCSVSEEVEFFTKYWNLTYVIETKDEAQNLLDFLEKMRNEKQEKEAAEKIEAEKSEIELRERITKEMEKKKLPKGFKEELDDYQRDGCDR